MKIAYVDTSFLVAIVFNEPGAARLALRLQNFEERVSSNLLEAELRSALMRQSTAGGNEALSGIGWIHPDRPLTGEFSRVLAAGHVKGADLWHLACALFFADTPGEITFLTLDARQKEVARKLGFAT